MSTPVRLLIVHPDPQNRMTLRRLFSRASLPSEVEECEDGRAALSMMRSSSFDCVFVDSELGGRSAAFVRELRSGGIHLPVVALSAEGNTEATLELMKAGAADYVNQKKLTAEGLQRCLRYTLALHRAEEERRLLLEREQHARQQAQAANRAKDEFLATLSHELRTPLNAILGWSRLLVSGHLDETTTRRAVEIIDRNTKLQAQLIDDLLDLSRVITGKLHLELRAVTVRSILETAVESVQASAEKKGIRIECDVSNADDTVVCDPRRMQQVVWNLLNNAVKFTPSEGVVRLSAERSNDHVVIAVCDSGIGIAPEFLPHVFDRFRQQDAATTRVHGGLGLGLSIVRHLIELHGGTVHAESGGEGQGSRFAVVVPLAPPRFMAHPAVETPRNGPGPELPSLAGIHVLVVDAEPDARALVSAILENRGAHVTCVGSSADAVAAIERERPDVILSDVAVPGEDGFALIRKIRTSSSVPQVPAAALMVFATASDRARAFLEGFQAHLPKPVEPSELAAVVASLAKRT